MDDLTNISVIRNILKEYNFSFSKSLGQNFLVNPSVCPKMAQYAVTGYNTGVIEIGPGIGVLTNELCKRAKKVVAIELDSSLLPVLEETLGEYDNLTVINDDVLKLDLKELIREQFKDMNVTVCANLPYYITSPVIMKLLEEKPGISSITVMIQKEAAQRICSKVGTRESGALTVAVHYYCDPIFRFSVSSGSFIPQPKVDSSVITLDVYERPSVEVLDEKLFFRVIKAGFSQRRKTVLNSFSSGLSLDKKTVNDILNLAGVDPALRVEKLTLEDFKNISDVIFKR